MIATLLLLNVGLGIFQEGRANAALGLLKQRLSALRARTLAMKGVLLTIWIRSNHPRTQ